MLLVPRGKRLNFGRIPHGRSVLMIICSFLAFAWKRSRTIQTGIRFPQTKRSRSAGGQCGRFCSIRAPSTHLAGPFTTTRAIKLHPANVISFPTNFQTGRFRIDPYRFSMHNSATLHPLPSPFAERFSTLLLFLARTRREAPERETSRMNRRLLQAVEKDQREIRIVHANANRRESSGGISLGGLSMRLFQDAARERVVARYASPEA